MTEDNFSMADFMDEVEKSMQRVSQGDLLTGTVAANNGEELIVNIGHMMDGIVPKEEVDFDGGESIGQIKIGESMTFYVLKTDDGEGNILLSKKRADAELIWDETAGLVSDQRPITVKIKEVVKGGLIAHYKGVRCFIPLSQMGTTRVEDPETLVGTTLQVLITEIQEDKKSMVASGRLLQERDLAKNKDTRFHELAVGQEISGTVKRLAEFGAFIDLGGIDGLIHLSELSWKRVKKVEDVLTIGQTVNVTITKIDAVNQKIGLKLVETLDNPWMDIHSHLNEGDVLMGEVTNLQSFGAFVSVKGGIEGLVHISQISEERIQRPQEKLHIGQEVMVRVMSVDAENQKLSLSIKEANASSEEDYEGYLEDDETSTSTLGDLFGDAFKNFKL
jgi:small subunit ribosomal protein S1